MIVSDYSNKKGTSKLSEMQVSFSCPLSGSLIAVAVEVYYARQTFEPIQLASNIDLFVRIPNAEFVMAIVARPHAMNWAILVQKPKDGEIYECPRVEYDDLTGWRSPCGVSSGHDANGITVGIIDIGFAGHTNFENMEFITDRSHAELPQESHGSRVSRIIGKNKDDLIGGICSNVNLVFYDVGYNNAQGKDAGMWQTEAVIDGIFFLAEKKGCKIINISGGLRGNSHSPGLQNAVKAAKNMGVICVAAAGNDPSQTVFAPAAYDDVIGVGGIGVSSAAPSGTYVNFVELAARNENLLSNNGLGYGFFHDINTSFGRGLDVVAPSVGIVLPVGDGLVMDLGGTSYAAPIVSSILALCASNDTIVYSTLGEARWKRLKEVLSKTCYDIGLPKERQGMGLPVWSRTA